jgi:hypothetical protein
MGKNNRNRRRGPGKGGPAARPAQQQPGQAPGGDRYQKYLPEWMRGNGSTTQAVRPPRPRRARQARPAGGYTPGKLAINESRLEG